MRTSLFKEKSSENRRYVVSFDIFHIHSQDIIHSSNVPEELKQLCQSGPTQHILHFFQTNAWFYHLNFIHFSQSIINLSD